MSRRIAVPDKAYTDAQNWRDDVTKRFSPNVELSKGRTWAFVARWKVAHKLLILNNGSPPSSWQRPKGGVVEEWLRDPIFRDHYAGSGNNKKGAGGVMDDLEEMYPNIFSGGTAGGPAPNLGAADSEGDPASGVVNFSHPRNLILYGPPGTSKTYEAVRKAIEIARGSRNGDVAEQLERFVEDGRIVFTTFHQSYSYEDFVEGIRPVTNGGTVTYEVKDGIFKALCRAADARSVTKPETADDVDTNSKRDGEGSTEASDAKPAKGAGNYVLVIDEINRGNISKILGELITSIEESKRMGRPDAIPITLPYSGDRFVVPDNVYIIGTMNTADRSLTQLDVALRRRFRFELLDPQPNKVTASFEENKNGTVVTVNVAEWLKEINHRIEILVDRDHTIGHAWFMELNNASATFERFANIVEHKVMPLLQEYFFEDWEQIRTVLGDNKKRDKDLQFIKKTDHSKDGWLPDRLKKGAAIYTINAEAFKEPGAYVLAKSTPAEGSGSDANDQGGNTEGGDTA